MEQSRAFAISENFQPFMYRSSRTVRCFSLSTDNNVDYLCLLVDKPIQTRGNLAFERSYVNDGITDFIVNPAAGSGIAGGTYIFRGFAQTFNMLFFCRYLNRKKSVL